MTTAAATATAKARNIVTVGGKDYVVCTPSAGKAYPDSTPAVFLSYWSTRNGLPFGPVRSTYSLAKPGTVGAKLLAAALAVHGLDLDEMIASVTA